MKSLSERLKEFSNDPESYARGRHLEAIITDLQAWENQQAYYMSGFAGFVNNIQLSLKVLQDYIDKYLDDDCTVKTDIPELVGYGGMTKEEALEVLRAQKEKETNESSTTTPIS